MITRSRTRPFLARRERRHRLTSTVFEIGESDGVRIANLKSVAAEVITSHPCFRCGHAKDVRRLTRTGDLVTLVPGSCVQSRTKTQWVYFILAGIVGVCAEGRSYLVERGGAIGLRSTLAGTTPTISIDAMTETTFLVVSARDLLCVMSGSQRLSEGFARFLARQAQPE